MIDGGSGQSIIHGGYGFNSPEIVDDSDPQRSRQDRLLSGKTGSGWSSEPSRGFNQTEQVLAAASSGQATWTFTSLPAGYYDVYVTWSPQADAATGAQYVVKDNNTPIKPVGQSSIATVDQTIAPADDQAAGVFWHHLGVFHITSGTLNVQLGSSSSGLVLADAVQLVRNGRRPRPRTWLWAVSPSAPRGKFPFSTRSPAPMPPPSPSASTARPTAKRRPRCYKPSR